jgi:hypothetical protein
MNAIDRERLLKWLKSLDSTYVTKEIIPQIESGAFDIKPPEIQWREQKLKNGWAQYRIDKLEKVEDDGR